MNRLRNILLLFVSSAPDLSGMELRWFFFLLLRAFCGTFPSGFCVVVDFHGSDTNGVRDGTQSRDA